MGTLVRRVPVLLTGVFAGLLAGCAVGSAGHDGSIDGRDGALDATSDGFGDGAQGDHADASADVFVTHPCHTDTDCDDHLACNGAETCGVDMMCHPGHAVNCADTFACTDDMCAEPSGMCNHVPHDDRCTGSLVCDPTAGCVPPPPCRVDADCDDHNNCNGREFCDPAFGCRTGSALDCDDHISCTVDSCDPSLPATGGGVDGGTDGGDAAPGDTGASDGAGGDGGMDHGACTHTPADVRCSDGNVCNGTEVCTPHDPAANTDGCVAGTMLNCQDMVDCTVDSCNPATGCMHVADSSRCDDHNVCNGAETCNATMGCQTGTALDCADTIGCTVDACDPTTGCSHTPRDSLCSDGNACNGIESCDGSGTTPGMGCLGGTTPNCDDMLACTTDSCTQTGTDTFMCRHNGDRDGDGHNATGCAGGDDCNDMDPNIYPGRMEICGNGIDDNCNGSVDEGCGGCTPGATGTCYDGPAGTQGVGTCRSGNHTCLSTDSWGTCTGEVTPQPEVCGNGLDDDCNGIVDNGCGVCIPGTTAGCYGGPAGTNGIGICHGGTHTCQMNDTWGPCVGEQDPVAEVCANGLDDDCSGVVDNGCGVCTPGMTGGCYDGAGGTQGVGPCHGGAHTCTMSDTWGTCTGEVTPITEICANGVDDDCSGVVDNGCGVCTPGTSGSCYDGPAATQNVGTCHGGNHTCTMADAWGSCVGEVVPVPEVCANGADDDCDGVVDNGCGVCTPGSMGSCYDGAAGTNGVGVCHGGTHTCNSMDTWGPCSGEVVPVMEICANGIDDDCNGIVDNGCGVCTPGATGPCYDGASGTNGIGACHGGTHTCTTSDTWGACMGEVVPTAEICANGVDDDCNGVVDNGCGVCTPGMTGPCYDGPAGTQGVGTCHGGSHTCTISDTWGMCTSEVVPTTEICANGIDEDCNGVPDNGCPGCTPGTSGSCYDGPAGTINIGVCHGGTHTCQSTDTYGACLGEVTPSPEICGNGLDDDCNGVVDNGCGVCTPGATQSCYTGTAGTNGVGVCHGGTATCTSMDTWGACVGQVIPSAEVCANGTDEDCNGVPDNGCPGCTPGTTQGCYTGPAGTSGVGICHGGTQTCTSMDTWGTCTGQQTPTAEVCANALDDDCNGVVDNGCGVCTPGATGACYDGPAGTQNVGLCHGGTHTCQSNDNWGACTGEVLPAAEVCANGLDEDCNAVPDNGCPGCTPGTTQMCYTGPAGTSGVGICHGGSQTCTSMDTWGICSGQQTPITEVCANSADDDCNGVVDNGCGVCTPGTTGSCYDGPAGTSGVGICHNGTHTCQSNDNWGACSGEQVPVAEVCANGLDDDCNAVVDNGCGVCTPGSTGACYDGPAGTNGVGACHGGTHTCQSNDTWGACGGEVMPIAEICGNGVDDDCNGVVDNGCGPANDHCAGAIALSMAGTSTSVSGTTVGSTHDVTSSCGFNGASPDVYYSFTLTAPTIVYADVEGATWDSVLDILSSCTGEATTTAGTVCDDDSCGTLQSQVYAVLNAGTYYILVSGYNGNSGAFTLHFQHEPAGGRGTFLLPAGSVTETGNTTGGSNLVAATCGAGSSGPEDAWYFARCPSTSASFSANTCTGTSWDSVVYLRPALGAETCNDDSCGLESSIAGSYATPAGTGQLFVVYVDGYGGSSGSYTLTSNMP